MSKSQERDDFAQDLITMASGNWNWADRNMAIGRIIKRFEDLEDRVLALEHRTGDHRRKPEET